MCTCNKLPVPIFCPALMAERSRLPPRARGDMTKGEITRALILDAALEVIAERGIAGTTHRLIATQADIHLSMTTYHFRSLGDLIESAFDVYVERTQQYRDQLAEQGAAITREYAERLEGAARMEANAQRNQQITQLLTDYVCRAIQRRTHLAVECAFVFAWHPTESLRAKVQRHNAAVVDLSTRFLSSVGSTNPPLDAEILTASVRQIEFQLVTSGDPVDPAKIQALLQRLITCLLG